MNKIIQFIPHAEASSNKNLEAFIKHAKDVIKLWSNLDGFNWHSMQWPTHDRCVRFINLKNRKWRKKSPPPQELVMSASFVDFAKAYLRYSQHVRPTKGLSRTIQMLRLIEASLHELGTPCCITKLSQRHLDKACELMHTIGYGDSAGLGAALERLANAISQWGLTNTNIRFWKHPFQGNSHKTTRKRLPHNDNNPKLPNDDAILALAEIFANGFHEKQDAETIFITCITCLLLCAPMRIGEILWYRKDLLREEKDAHGNNQLYLAYWVPKNGRFVRKEVPEIMAEHAKEAIKRLIEITDEGRRLARHYESGSTKFYRHTTCPEVPDDQVLTRDQVTAALGLKSYKSAQTFIKTLTGSIKITGLTLNKLWKLVLKRHKSLNPHFPYQQAPRISDASRPLKMSESLICLRLFQLSTVRFSTSPILLAPSNSSFYINRLSNAEPTLNIFRKFGYGDLTLRSHQLRHFLNTLAQEAGLGIEQITQWSTRASSTQTRIYMHQDPKRQAEKIADQLNIAPIYEQKPITNNEYNIIEKGPIITTRYGICSHDYTLTPCQKHADCLNCSELLMCKGHKRSIESIRQERDRIAENLIASKAKIDAGHRVAGRWHEAHFKSLIRLDQLLKIMTDPSIENGSPIQMRGKDFSHERRILNKKYKMCEYIPSDINSIGIEYGSDLVDCLRLLSEEENV